MDCPIAYDITRLVSRVYNATPNGIDRVDMALAQYFLSHPNRTSAGMVFLGPFGHRTTSRDSAIEAVEIIANHFGETDNLDNGDSYRRIRNWLLHGALRDAIAPHRVFHPRSRLVSRAARWIVRHGVPFSSSSARNLPEQARYINISQYPLAIADAFHWRRARPDVKLIFFVHDMLPLKMPEYFREQEFGNHQRRIRNVAEHGAGAIVSTAVVKEALQKHLVALGRNDLPILVAPLPVAPIFLVDDAPDRELSAEPFFIQCGTLEPRKNHLMILHVWRELIARQGSAAPKLLLIGARGWKNANIFDLLERSPSLRNHVLEVSGLPTPSLRRLLKSARGLLMPSFGEGFGLPLAEALALGTPAIASDIPAFREMAGDQFTRLSPIDGEGWLRAIEAFAERAAPVGHRQKGAVRLAKPEDFFRAVDHFVGSL
jgi:glycosyltransferase involved in cell wall biosynthesis